MIEIDRVPPKVRKAMTHLKRRKVSKHVTKLDREAYLTFLKWCVQQYNKHGLKPAGEQPAMHTVSFSPEEKEILWQLVHARRKRFKLERNQLTDEQQQIAAVRALLKAYATVIAMTD